MSSTPTMHAAVVRDFARPPRCESYDVPTPSGEDDELVDVVAVGLHPRVRSGASGQHYSSSGRLPMIPGVDGVGRRSDGSLVYFLVGDDAWGSMADVAIVDHRRSLPVPPDVDPVLVAAAMNPAMSSWVALRQRAHTEGAGVVVVGATGSAGTLAVQVAAQLGARAVIGVGRDPDRLEHLRTVGATSVVSLASPTFADDLAGLASEVDIVLDYVWSEPSLRVMMSLLSVRRDKSRLLDWIEIGAVGGPTMDLPAAALRSTNLRIQGSGQGSVSPAAYRSELPDLLALIATGAFTISPRAVALADVEVAWATPDAPGTRTVVVPG